MILKTYAHLRTQQPDEPNVREFIISTETEDRHGTIIKMDGWDLTNYTRNPIVMYGHAANENPDPDLVIGSGEVRFEKGQMIGKITFDVDGDGSAANQLAKKVLYKIDKGFLNATSVGFMPHEYRMGAESEGEDVNKFYFTKQELLEFSVVPVPSNPDAVKKELKAFAEKNIEELKVSKKDREEEFLATRASENKETDKADGSIIALQLRAQSLKKKIDKL